MIQIYTLLGNTTISTTKYDVADIFSAVFASSNSGVCVNYNMKIV